MTSRNKSFLLFLLLSIAGKAQDITFTEMLNWINAKEYPTSFFGELELKRFTFSKTVQYDDCTGYQYNSNKNDEDYRCFITAFICKSTVTAYLPIEVERRYEIQAHKGGKIVYDYLASKIKQYCTKIKEEEAESGLASAVQIYKHTSGVYFTFHSEFNNGFMVYYIMVQKESKV